MARAVAVHGVGNQRQEEEGADFLDWEKELGWC